MVPIFNFKKLKDNENKKEHKINSNLISNLKYMKDAFSLPMNSDVIIREFIIKTLNKKAFLIFLDGMVDVNIISSNLIHPFTEDSVKQHTIESLLNEVSKIKNYTEKKYFEEIINDILSGNTALFIEGSNNAYAFDTSKYETRSITTPIREPVIKGPQEAFVESGYINSALIRKYLQSETLITEKLMVGKRSISSVNVLYIKDLANTEIVEEIKNKIKDLDVDAVEGIEMLEQMLEERPYSPIPQALNTERPDRTASFLLEGHVAILMDRSSSSLILPVTFWALFHTPEDTYHRWINGNFSRIIRSLALFLALFTPSLYVAITTFHVAMVPTDLLLAISATRETVPFPVIIEILLMEISFELLREAGIRVPTPMGPTIGIVGALILGQAAVEANIVSPILVIIVAITGLCSFSISNNNLNYTIRITRFFLLALASLMGFLGITAGVIIMLAYATSVSTFGVPFMSPRAPNYKSNNDFITRPVIWKSLLRPSHIRPQDTVRKKAPKGGKVNEKNKWENWF